jgi:hypothetical protein
MHSHLYNHLSILSSIQYSNLASTLHLSSPSSLHPPVLHHLNPYPNHPQALSQTTGSTVYPVTSATNDSCSSRQYNAFNPNNGAPKPNPYPPRPLGLRHLPRPQPYRHRAESMPCVRPYEKLVLLESGRSVSAGYWAIS